MMADEIINPASSETDSSLESDLSTVIKSPFCGSLRSKKFFMMDGLATEAEQYLDSSNHCWCRETQQVVGPDGGRVRPERCVPGRSCYISALDSL